MLYISGIVAILTGPVQLWLGLTDRGMTWLGEWGSLTWRPSEPGRSARTT
jgi:hypothetical protein